MFCSKCGNEIDNEALICPKCGCATANMVNMNAQKAAAAQTEETSTLATCAIVFAILMPIVGLILGIIGTVKYKNEKYKGRCVSAIVWSIVIWAICFALFYCFAIIM